MGRRCGGEGKRGNGKDRGEISKMDIRSGQRGAGLFDEGEIAEREVRGRAGRRAWGYEKRLEEGRVNEVARVC